MDYYHYSLIFTKKSFKNAVYIALMCDHQTIETMSCDRNHSLLSKPAPFIPQCLPI